MEDQKLEQKWYWDDTQVRYLLILSKGRGILDPMLFNNFVKLVNKSYWTFCQDIDNIDDIKQDVYLRILETWSGYDPKKADPLPYFTEIIKRHIYLTIQKLNGRKKDNKINPVWISLDKIFYSEQ